MTPNVLLRVAATLAWLGMAGSSALPAQIQDSDEPAAVTPTYPTLAPGDADSPTYTSLASPDVRQAEGEAQSGHGSGQG